jgi:hypothetical protein
MLTRNASKDGTRFLHLQGNKVALSRYRLDTQTGSKKERVVEETDAVADWR